MIRGLRKDFANSERAERSHAMTACSPDFPSCESKSVRVQEAAAKLARAKRAVPPQAPAIYLDVLREELTDCDSGSVVRAIVASLVADGLSDRVGWALEMEQHRRLGRTIRQQVLL